MPLAASAGQGLATSWRRRGRLDLWPIGYAFGLVCTFVAAVFAKLEVAPTVYLGTLLVFLGLALALPLLMTVYELLPRIDEGHAFLASTLGACGAVLLQARGSSAGPFALAGVALMLALTTWLVLEKRPASLLVRRAAYSGTLAVTGAIAIVIAAPVAVAVAHGDPPTRVDAFFGGAAMVIALGHVGLFALSLALDKQTRASLRGLFLRAYATRNASPARAAVFALALVAAFVACLGLGVSQTAFFSAALLVMPFLARLAPRRPRGPPVT